MIPAMNIVAWGQSVPWVDQRQVEQDLIISRALVEIFSNSFLSKELRFRGGTALNKLHFAKLFRYSEDIDFTRTTTGPIGPILAAIRRCLEPWMGRAKFEQSPVAPKLRFRITSEDKSSSEPIRVKVEINFQETTAYEPAINLPFAVTESVVHRQGRDRNLCPRRDSRDQTARAPATRKGPRPYRPFPCLRRFRKARHGVCRRVPRQISGCVGFDDFARAGRRAHVQQAQKQALYG